MYKPTKWANRVKDEKGNIIADGTGLWAKYLNNMESGIVRANLLVDSEGKPNGIATLDDNGIVHSSQLPANLKEIEIVYSLKEMEDIKPKFKGLRVMILQEDSKKWSEYVHDGSKFIEVANSDKFNIVIDWHNIKDKPREFKPEAHKHLESSIDDLDKYTKAETDKLLAPKITEEHNIIQTVYNAIGWEKNILFKADERFTVIEHNTKVGKSNYKTFFDGGLDPISIQNVNKGNPYIIEISGLPAINTQGKGTIGFVSRFRYPRDFKIEWYNSRDNKWELLVEKTNWDKAYFYSDNFTGSATKIKLTFTRVQGDDFLQLAQIVFINPEAAIMYDHLLAKDYDLKVFGESLAKLESILDTVVKVKHDHSNKDVLDKVAYTGSKTQLNLEDIYSHSHNWDGIKNKPTEFKPGEHTHSIGEVTNLQATLDSLESKIESGGGGAVTSVNGKTGEVVLSAGDIEYMPGLDMSIHDSLVYLTDELYDQINSKADQDHTHSEYAKITDLPENFDILKKLVDLGNNSQIDLDLIYTHKHKYSEIQNKPTIPNKITDLNDDINLVSSDKPRKILVSESSPVNPNEGDIWIRL